MTTADRTALAAAPAGHRASRWRRRLGEALFPPDGGGRVSGGALLGAAAAVVAGTLVSLARQPGVGALDTVYDEDARIFLADAAALSPLEALTTPYQGYYHLLPRLLAEVAALFPAGRAAAVMAVLAALVTSLLALFVFVAARAHVPYWPLRLVVSVPVVTLPLAQEEIPNALCNLHWPLLYATVWALLWVPARTGGRVAAVLVVAATVTSDLLALAYLPLLLARLVADPATPDPAASATGTPAAAPRRDRYRLVLALALGGGLALQFGGLVLNDNPRDLGEPKFNPVWALLQFALRPVPQSLVGERWPGTDPDTTGYLLWAGIGWLLVLAVLFVAWRRWTAPNWLLAAVLTAQAAALYAESVMASGLAAPRYAAAPALMVLSALAVLVAPRRIAVPALALVCVVAVAGLVNLRVDNSRADGPSWAESIAYARTVCVADPAGTVEVPVAPASTGRVAVLPCRYLLG